MDIPLLRNEHIGAISCILIFLVALSLVPAAGAATDMIICCNPDSSHWVKFTIQCDNKPLAFTNVSVTAIASEPEVFQILKVILLIDNDTVYENITLVNATDVMGSVVFPLYPVRKYNINIANETNGINKSYVIFPYEYDYTFYVK